MKNMEKYYKQKTMKGIKREMYEMSLSKYV